MIVMSLREGPNFVIDCPYFKKIHTHMLRSNGASSRNFLSSSLGKCSLYCT